MRIGFLPLLALLFIGLKLGGVIAWSWIWVLAPLWVLPVLIVVILVLAAVIDSKG
jgi:hypothetical protein